jgi:hypothetical protein
MIDAVSAELLKLLCLRATWLLAWIYPIMLALLTLGILIYGLTSGRPPPEPASATKWSLDTANFWLFPQSSFGRYLVASFAVFCTASEYGWNTWKLIVPARARWQLLAAKLVAALVLLFTAFVAADIVALAGAAMNAVIVGPPAPDAVSASMLARDHLNGLASVVAPTLYTVALATCLSVVTRSALAALLVSVALITLEGLLPLAAVFAYGYAPALTHLLVEALPFYHLANIKSWFQEGTALLLPLGATAKWSGGLALSLLVTGIWTFLLAAGAILHFKRQDLD